MFKLRSASVSIDEKVIEEIIPEKKEEKEEGKEEGNEEGKEEGEEKETEGTDEANSEGSGEEEKVDDSEKTEESEAETVEKEYREYIDTHTFTLEPDEVLHGARLLNKDQIKEARKRITSLEKRDEEKKLTDEAKNSFESLIYEFRDFLRDEDNFLYIKEADRDSLMQKLEQSEEWLYDDGSDVGYKVYQEKSYELMTDYSKYKKRKEQAQSREDSVPAYLEELQNTRTKAIEIREKMPWVTE